MYSVFKLKSEKNIIIDKEHFPVIVFFSNKFKILNNHCIILTHKKQL